ncbi:hypothetical protein KAS79_00415 [Candidatus Parcubacteria bacterium]|nr:hypothetical protein [Candidatus Parcubacteria bacterium]
MEGKERKRKQQRSHPGGHPGGYESYSSGKDWKKKEVKNMDRKNILIVMIFLIVGSLTTIIASLISTGTVNKELLEIIFNVDALILVYVGILSIH